MLSEIQRDILKTLAERAVIKNTRDGMRRMDGSLLGLQDHMNKDLQNLIDGDPPYVTVTDDFAQITEAGMKALLEDV